MNETKTPSIENKLRMLLLQGKDCVDVVQNIINKDKLPFFVEQLEPEKWELRSVFSAGELFSQKFITVDKETIDMKADAAKMSITPYEVLIFGETGTGKELIAKSQISNRKGAIKSVNCAGFPRELIESELFGYAPGAFTGANQRGQEGLISAASDGVMFMDEVGELPMDIQAKLLRVIQEKKVRRVGGKIEEDINCKFVFASNRDLQQMVEQGLFRKDLYARLSTLELFIKPIRDRVCDVIPIIESLPEGKKFLDRYRNDIELFEFPLNVRSILQYVIRYNVLGKAKKEI